MARRGGLGGAARRRAVGRRRRLALGLPGVARSGLACCGEEGRAWRGSAVEARPGARRVGSGAARAKRVPNAHSARAPGVHGTCST